MTLKIDFYLAKAPTFQQCRALCYELINNEYQQMKNISILFKELAEARHFSDTLWSQQANSFIPHDIDQNKVRLNIERPHSNQALTQCNMQTTQDNLLEHINHLIQIVPNNETDKQQARILYKSFTTLGHQITVHKDA
jgi:DNA polymerase IIIc chi subunit